MAWATGIANAVAKSKTGADVDGLVYKSDVFEKREGRWLLVSQYRALAVPKPLVRSTAVQENKRSSLAFAPFRTFDLFCRRKSAEGGLDPFAEPSGADRCLRTADGRCGRQAAIAGCDDGRPSGAPAAREMICDHFDGATGRRGARRDPEPTLRQTSALALEIVPDGQRLELGDEAQPLRRVRGNDRL